MVRSEIDLATRGLGRGGTRQRFAAGGAEAASASTPRLRISLPQQMSEWAFGSFSGQGQAFTNTISAPQASQRSRSPTGWGMANLLFATARNLGQREENASTLMDRAVRAEKTDVRSRRGIARPGPVGAAASSGMGRKSMTEPKL
jgi:hypothetical protein